MKRIKNNHGMTLMEIVVVLLISSIVMVIVGGMLLSSMGYFNRGTVASQDKEGLDDIASYVRKELMYATEVYVGETKPDDRIWDEIHVENNRLYHNESLLLDEEFYGRRNLTITLLAIKEGYRLDLNFKYSNTEGSEVYTTRTSLNLVSLEINSEHMEGNIIFPNLVGETTISSLNKIFYIKDPMKPEELPGRVSTGLVGDQIDFLNNENNYGSYVGGRLYPFGAIVFYEGAWYYKMTAFNTGDATFENGNWKKLVDEFTKGSAYQVGDKVSFDDKYYMCVVEYKQQSWVNDPAQSSYHFKEVSKEEVDNTIYENTLKLTVKTVKSQLNDVKIESILEYDTNKEYAVGTYVKKTNSDGIPVYYYYTEDVGGRPGERVNGLNGWKTLEIYYDPNSYYSVNDIVMYNSLNQIQGAYQMALKNHPSTNEIAKSNNDTDDWKYLRDI